MMKLIFLDGLFFLLLTRGLNGEVYSSTAHLSTVLNTGKEIIKQLEKYIKDAEAKTARLQNYVNLFNNILEPSSADEIINNPLSAYQLIKQLLVDWESVEQLLNDSFEQEIIQEIHTSRQDLLMPKEQDLVGAAMAILRLQEMYNLNISDLARGNILGIQSSIRLTIGDCLHLGKCCTDYQFFDLAVKWYDQALLMSKEDTNQVVDTEEISQYLDEARKAMENEGFQDSITSARSKYKLGLELSPEEEATNFYALCRGEQLRNGLEEAKLNCYLSDRRDASFYINPIKVEVHSHDPPIFTFHDVIYESEINFIKEFSKPRLQRSTVADDHVTDARISQNTWLFDEDEDRQLRQKLKIITGRLSRITGLNIYGINNSEPLQVANYGIGGYYYPHFDFFQNSRYQTPEELDNVNPVEYETGNRLSTTMFYLSDVNRGGATVFPRIGAAVWPKKGSAAFWYNIRKNGEVDLRTSHGGCPVLHGSKWIGNKWTHELSQAFKWPCSLNPND